jgi:hypothetical protein
MSRPRGLTSWAGLALAVVFAVVLGHGAAGQVAGAGLHRGAGHVHAVLPTTVAAGSTGPTIGRAVLGVVKRDSGGAPMVVLAGSLAAALWWAMRLRRASGPSPMPAFAGTAGARAPPGGSR